MDLLLLLLFAEVFGHDMMARYDGYQVYEITPHNENQLKTLKQLQEITQVYDFWTDVTAVENPVDVMVAPHLRGQFQDMLDLHGLNATLKINNVQELIDVERAAPKSAHYNWNQYGTLDQMYSWLKSLAQTYPNIVKTVVGGKSYEGREILGVKVSFKSGNKGVFIEGGIHAREWIAPATVTYILNELLTNKDPAVRKVAESRDWYVFPVINPDGYVYTHNRNRYWRKNRNPQGLCVGVDLNRNWGYHWNQGGVSHDPCSEIFCGESAFSEMETKSLSKYITSVASTLDTYLAVHSYGQFIMIPFCHDGNERPPNYKELMTIGKNAANELASHFGTTYKVGAVMDIMYEASGSSMDWAVGVHRNIRIGYAYELRDKGQYGFNLPPKQIVPTGIETFASVISIIKQANQIHI